jgi:FkbM family methyltransferase
MLRTDTEQLIRRAISSVIRSDSAVYRFGSAAYNMLEVTRREGLRTARTCRKLAHRQKGTPQSLQLRNLVHPILVRPGTPDVSTVVDNIIREEHGHYPPKREPTSMIDAGAYIGDTGAYFMSKYPSLKLVALEPDPDNYEMASKNLAPYGDRAVLLNKALSSSPGVVHISGAYVATAVTNAGRAIEATTVTDLMALMGWQRLSILKLDIEGAEAEVLGQSAHAWLDRIDKLIVEAHGPTIEAHVKKTLRQSGFAVKRYRSLLHCSREINT